MNQFKKRVFFAIPSLESGGMERVMSEIVTFFSNIQGIECSLIIYGKPAVDFYDIPNNVKIYRPSFQFNDKKPFESTIKTLLFVRSIIKKNKADVVLSFGEYWNNFVLLALLGIKIRIYVSDRSSPEKSLGKFHNFLRRKLYLRTAGIIAQTMKAKKVLESDFPNNNIKVIGNPIRYIQPNHKLTKENIVLSVGRLITSKNFDRLINIFSRINNPDWKLIIIGGDSNKEINSIKLQSQIDRSGMVDRIQMVGVRKNIEEYLLSAKIFAFTSSSEGFPNVIGEAMSAGLPVISYDCVAGPSDMIEDGKNGFLIPLFDDQMFEKKLCYLMDHNSEREAMGNYAKESIKKFSVDKIGNDFFNFIVLE